MPRDSNGIYTLPAGNPVISGTIIESNWANPTMADIGNEITDSLSRNGEGGMLAPLRHVNGTAAAPAITWISEPTSGWYRAAAGDFRYSIATTDVFRIIPGAVEVWDGSSWNSITPGAFLETDGTNFMTGILRVDTANGDHARIGHGRVISGLNQIIYGYSDDGSGATQGVYGAQLLLTGVQATLRSNATATSTLNLTTAQSELNCDDSFLYLRDDSQFFQVGRAGIIHVEALDTGSIIIRGASTPIGVLLRDTSNTPKASFLWNESLDRTELRNDGGGGGVGLFGNAGDCSFTVHPTIMRYFMGATERFSVNSTQLELHSFTLGGSNLLSMTDTSNIVITQYGYSSTFGGVILEVFEDGTDFSILMNLAGGGGANTEFMRFDATNDLVMVRNTVTGGGNLERALTTSDIPSKFVLSADSTRTSTTTPTAEADFDQQYSIPAGGKARVRMGLMVDQGGGANGGFRIAYGQANFNFTANHSYIDTTSALVTTGTTGVGAEVLFSVTPANLSTARRLFEVEGILENPTGAPLDVIFEWSQQTSSGTATTMYAGSWVEISSL